MLAHPDARTVLRSVLKAWMPLSEAVLSMAVDHLPDPATAAPGRLARLLPPQQLHLTAARIPAKLQKVRLLGGRLLLQLSQQETAIARCTRCCLSMSHMAAASAKVTAKGLGILTGLRHADLLFSHVLICHRVATRLNCCLSLLLLDTLYVCCYDYSLKQPGCPIFIEYTLSLTGT